MVVLSARKIPLAAHVCTERDLDSHKTNGAAEYGQCGVGAYCLGGCDPVNSFSLDACVPAPVCQSKTYKFDNLDGVVSNTKYLGDASKADWVSSGTPLSYDGSVLLTMAEGTVGTLLASTTYVWYGKVSAKFSTSAGAGVVTAFILLGDSKDEIDFEFVGVELESAQTNFYSQGVTNCKFLKSLILGSMLICIDNNGGNTTGLSDVHANMHEYEIDWQYDTITWSIDGKVVRTLDRDSTWNATANRYSYPQTPCRVQLSLWPGGLSTNGKGTIDWAGGLVQWDSQYMENGYYYATFDEVSVQCYDPPSNANINGSKSYIFTDDTMTNSTVEITDENTVLKSFLATGLNMTLGSSASASASGSAKTSDVETVPGLSGGGTGNNGQRGDNTTDSSSSSDSGSSSASATGSASTGFVQGDGSGSGSGAGQLGGNSEAVLRGSLFAVVIAVIGLCVL